MTSVNITTNCSTYSVAWIPPEHMHMVTTSLNTQTHTYFCQALEGHVSESRYCKKLKIVYTCVVCVCVCVSCMCVVWVAYSVD